jgi:predicted nucleotide-binding protein
MALDAAGPERAMPTTIFIGSSSAAKSQARAVIRKFSSPRLKFLPWWDAFTAGRTLLEDLDNVRAKVDGALLLFSPESTTRIRNKKYNVPNLNVLFEFAYFYGHFGRKRVAMLKYGEFYLPSDLGGYIHISGSRSFRRGAAVQVGKRTSREIERWVSQL